MKSLNITVNKNMYRFILIRVKYILLGVNFGISLSLKFYTNLVIHS